MKKCRLSTRSRNTSHLRRTSLVLKADRRRTDDERFENVFQFNDAPFKIPLQKPDVKVEVTVFHQVEGIRQHKIAAGSYEGDERGDKFIPLLAANTHNAIGTGKLNVKIGRFDPREGSMEEEEGILSNWPGANTTADR